MEKMKLAKALKVKNRMAGEITKLKQVITNHNVVRERIISPGTPDEKVFKRERPIDVTKAVLELTKLVKDLVQIKTAIAKANVGIYEKIALMDEAKGMMAYFEAMPKEREDDTDTSNGVTTVTRWDIALKSKYLMGSMEGFKKTIEDLQDQIDEYNATTYIEF